MNDEVKTTNKQVITCRFHKPVCVKCECEMRPSINGVAVLDKVGWGDYQLTAGDEWECPYCGIKVIGGFGNNPISSHFDDDFQQCIEEHKSLNKLRICNCN